MTEQQKKALWTLDGEEESEYKKYKTVGNKDTAYEDRVSDDNNHIQDDDEFVSSGSTNKVIQNIDVLNQSDVKNNNDQPSNDWTTKSASQFMEGCKMPCYTNLLEN